jgi:hypothetical protein
MSIYSWSDVLYRLTWVSAQKGGQEERRKMNESRTARSTSESALLTSLRTGVRPPAEATAWALPSSAALEAEIRRFECEFGPLIEQAASVQQQLSYDPEIRRLSEASAETDQIDPNGHVNPKALGVAASIAQNSSVVALGSSAQSMGCKGMGLTTLNLEAALIFGAQVGMETVWLWPYKIGTFKTPSRIVTRAWWEATVGLDVGISGSKYPFPLDLSFWFLPPENSDHMLGVFLGVVYKYGVRVELFGWVPEKPDPPRSGGLIDVNPFNFIYGFRILAERGYHIGLGLAFKGQQVASTGGINLPTYYMNPSNIQAGRKYDGTSSNQPLLEGVVTPPSRDDVPSKTFRTGETPSTLQLSFPNWLCSGMLSAPAITFKNDGGDKTGGWQLGPLPPVTDLTYTFKWGGDDNQAWQSPIDFTIMAYSTSVPPTNGAATCKLDGLTNVGPVEVPISLSGAAMTLSAQVFTATGFYTLNVDSNYFVIRDYSGYTFNASVQASTAEITEDSFYYLPNPNNDKEKLIIDYIGTDPNNVGKSWYVGYQYRQQDGTSNAQFTPVLWEYGKSFSTRTTYIGTWKSLVDSAQKYESTATWSNGTINDTTTLSMTLTPIPS